MGKDTLDGGEQVEIVFARKERGPRVGSASRRRREKGFVWASGRVQFGTTCSILASRIETAAFGGGVSD